MGIESFLQNNKCIALDTNVFIALFAREVLGKKVVPLIDAAANQGIPRGKLDGIRSNQAYVSNAAFKGVPG